MKLTFANILMFLLATLACSSCVYEDMPEPDDELTPDQLPGDVYLNLSVGVLTQLAEPSSRANDNIYFEGPERNYERIKSFRIIIVRGDRLTDISYVTDSTGYIEHNHLYNNFAETGVDFHDNMVFKVRGGEKKKIYLIANEAYLKAKGLIDFDELKPGTRYPSGRIEDIILEAAPDNVLFDNTGANPTYIPMSESYDIDVPVPQSPEDYNMYRNMFITRAAVKFSFIINTAEEDYPDRGILIKGITVNGIADCEYFLPRAKYDPPKEEESTNWSEGRYVEEFIVPEEVKTLYPYTFPTAIPLKYYNDEYELPENSESIKKIKGCLYAPAIYFPETPKPLNGKKNTVTITIGTAESTDDDYTFPEVNLPNLPELPRNTHVVIYITINKAELTATVELVPYIGVDLEPSFGF